MPESIAVHAARLTLRKRCSLGPHVNGTVARFSQEEDTEQGEEQDCVQEGHEDLRHDPRLRALRERGRFEHGCEHYKRRCRMVAPCCGEVFWCRHCHNKAKNEEEEASPLAATKNHALVLLPHAVMAKTDAAHAEPCFRAATLACKLALTV